MNTIIPGIAIAIVIFLGLQMILPFPYGIILGIIIGGLIIRYTIKHVSIGKDSLLNYKRADPLDDKERAQNEEALRILEKKYIEDKISKEEYMKRKKEFENIEDEVMKCKVCGSEEFEFVLDTHIEEIGEPVSDEGYYRCKKCGAK